MSADKPKLIVFSHISSAAIVTGAERLLLLFIRELSHRFRCTLVVPQNGVMAQQARGLGIAVMELDVPISTSLYTASPTLRQEIEALKGHPSWRRLHALLTEQRPDYALVNTSVHPLPAMAARSLGIPTLWLLMETIMPSPNRGAAAAFIAEHSDIVLGISQSALRPVEEAAASAGKPVNAFGIPPYLEREALGPGSWPYQRFRFRQQHALGEEHRIAGYIAATIYAAKGLDSFIRAMLPIAAANVNARFVVLGNPVDPVHYGICRRLVQQSGYAERFVFVPFAEHIQSVYPALDVVVVPSLVAEGFGMTALEGMMFGKAVVAYASGALAETLASTGNEAFLVPTGDTEGLTAKVRGLLDNESLLRAVGERNALAAQRTFGIEAFRARLNELMARLPAPSPIRSGLWRGSGPTVYLVENGAKRPFATPEALLKQGYTFEQVIVVPDDLLARLPEGPRITAATAAPAGAGGAAAPAARKGGSGGRSARLRRRAAGKRGRRKGRVRARKGRIARGGRRRGGRKRRTGRRAR